MLFRLWLLSTLIHFGFQATGEPFVIKSANESQVLSNYATYLVDSVGLSITDVQQLTFSKTIAPEFYKRSDVVFWTKVAFRNETSFEQFILTIDQWNEVDFFVLEGGKYVGTRTGTSTKVEDRPISLHRLISFPFVLQPQTEKVVFIRTKVSQPLMRYYAKQFSFLSKIELDELGFAYSKYIGNQMLVVFVLGVVGILFVYSLSLFFLEGQKTSLILSLYFIVVGLEIANIHGITTNYLFPNSTAFEMYLALNLAFLIPIVVCGFMMAFFKLKFNNWEFYVLAGFMLFMASLWIASFQFSQSLLFFERRYLEYAVILLVLASSVVKKKEGSIILLIAILATIPASFFSSFKAVFFENSNFLTSDLPYLLGVSTQVLIFSVASTYRVRLLRKGVESLQEEHRQLVQGQNEELKKQVESKTQQLQEAFQALEVQRNELQAANKELVANGKLLSEQSLSIRKLNEQLEELVVRRTEALKAALKDLDVFFYRVSHDLRRPLTTILGLIHLIQRETDIEKIASFTTNIQKTVVNVDRMLRKLIAISLCYQEELNEENCSISEIVGEAIDEIDRQYSLENYSITTNLSPCLLLGDRFLLRAIIECAVENAIIFGGENVSILVECRCENDFFILSISDNGRGIRPDFLEKAFDMFVKGDNRSTGNGLGLYLAKLATEKLHGNIFLESTGNAGTELRMIFPIELATMG